MDQYIENVARGTAGEVADRLTFTHDALNAVKEVVDFIPFVGPWADYGLDDPLKQTKKYADKLDQYAAGGTDPSQRGYKMTTLPFPGMNGAGQSAATAPFGATLDRDPGFPNNARLAPAVGGTGSSMLAPSIKDQTYTKSPRIIFPPTQKYIPTPVDQTNRPTPVYRGAVIPNDPRRPYAQYPSEDTERILDQQYSQMDKADGYKRYYKTQPGELVLPGWKTGFKEGE
jgi:hypothetical protein